MGARSERAVAVLSRGELRLVEKAAAVRDVSVSTFTRRAVLAAARATLAVAEPEEVRHFAATVATRVGNHLQGDLDE